MAEKEKKKNSFGGIIVVVFAVLLCFGLTVYGIVYLTGKVFSSEEVTEAAKIKIPNVSTDPEKGDILTFSSQPEKEPNVEEVPETIVSQPYGLNDSVEGNIPAPAQEIKPAEPKEEAKPAPKQEAKPAPKQEAKPAPKQEAKEPVKIVTSPVGKGAFVVQIMAVKNKTEAEKEAEKYRSVCSDIFVQKADLGAKGTWYRLRCGATDSKETAAKTRDMLKSRFKNISPQVVSNK